MSFVRPSTWCRRCETDFGDVDAFRAHWREVHEDEGDSNDGDAIEVEEEEALASVALSAVASVIHTRLFAGPTFSRALVRVADTSRCVSVLRALLSRVDASVRVDGVDDALCTEAHASTLNSVIAPGETWIIMLYRGGFFAAIHTSVSPSDPPQTLLHKRFARYTTRRKQGGSQSAHDNATGRAASSVGAQMRRAGEVALVADVHALLRTPAWVAGFRHARRIFVSASATTIGDLFDGSTLARGDARIARVPLATGRPSVEEAERVAREISRVDDVGVHAELLEEARALASASAAAISAAVSAAATTAAARAAERDAAAAATRAADAAARAASMARKEAARRIRAAGRAVAAAADGDGDSNDDADWFRTADVDGSDGGGAAGAAIQHRASAGASGRNAASNARDSGADSDERDLAEAVALAKIEARTMGGGDGGPRRHAGGAHSIFCELEGSISQLAARTGVPARALSAALRVPRAGSAAPRAELDAARDAAALVTSLLADGAQAEVAFSAMGWDALAAAVSVGVGVDWNAMCDADEESFDDLAARIAPPSSRKGGGKKGSRKSSTRDAVPTAPPPLPSPPPPLAALSAEEEQRRKRDLMLAAAEARFSKSK